MDQFHPEVVQSPDEARSTFDYDPTGIQSVDRVLAEVSAVGDAPIGEHVPVFERAHERLRQALDARPEPTTDDDQGS